MTTIIVAKAVQACLEPLKEQTELRGADGVLLGYFTPVSDLTARIYEEAKARFKPDVNQARAAHQGPWLTTEEVLQRLESPE